MDLSGEIVGALKARLQLLCQVALSCRQVGAHLWTFEPRTFSTCVPQAGAHTKWATSYSYVCSKKIGQGSSILVELLGLDWSKMVQWYCSASALSRNSTSRKQNKLFYDLAFLQVGKSTCTLRVIITNYYSLSLCYSLLSLRVLRTVGFGQTSILHNMFINGWNGYRLSG